MVVCISVANAGILLAAARAPAGDRAVTVVAVNAIGPVASAPGEEPEIVARLFCGAQLAGVRKGFQPGMGSPLNQHNIH